MIPIGLNGFGRIGKCIFIQMLSCKFAYISTINAPSFPIQSILTYLKYDSSHRYVLDEEIKIVDENHFSIGEQIIKVVRTRDAKTINWRSHNIQYVIDATGSYLTKESCQDHGVPYVIMTAPSKDNTPVFVFGVNHENYKGESIISNASCTTNSITPVLYFFEYHYGIKQANFITIHATTASQTTIDMPWSYSRTHRSILNNIIPHTTGASKSIIEVMPSLKNKIFGTSVRVPVSNVSMIDLNIELNSDISFEELFIEIDKNPYIEISKEQLVSSDFMTTMCPSIVDKQASMPMGKNTFKITIFYDNEWSYSAQVIRILDTMISYNKSNKA